MRLTVPRPREDQRLVGVVDVERGGDGEDGDGRERVTLAVETASDGHATVELRERERDGVLRAFRAGDSTLVGRVKRVSTVEKE